MTYEQFSPAAEAALRASYGTLAILQMTWSLPHARRFFTSEKYQGYIESSRIRDWLHTPLSAYCIFAIWVIALGALVAGFYPLPAAVINFALAHYFFVTLRWKSILRGMGAPGHMNYWLAAAVLFLSLGDAASPGIPLRAIAVVAFRLDFALIMIAAGIYKVTAGYARGDGFERGLVNPWWGWWSTWLRKISDRNVAFTVLNHSAYLAEIFCGMSFLVPALAPYGALVLGLSFLGIAGVIRLTFLAEMVAVCCLLYVWPHSPADTAFAHIFRAAPHPAGNAILDAGARAAAVLLAAYVALLPFAYAVMVTNFYFKRRLPETIQSFFDRWNRFFGLILWRVFTNDIVNFHCQIYERRLDGAERAITGPMRFSHVGEFITLASIFTTLKYYPGRLELFETRIVRYVRSLRLSAGSRAIFRYVRIEHASGSFAFRHVAEFEVDPRSARVVERLVDTTFDVRAVEPGSPIHASGLPGSYAPVLKR